MQAEVNAVLGPAELGNLPHSQRARRMGTGIMDTRARLEAAHATMGTAEVDPPSLAPPLEPPPPEAHETTGTADMEPVETTAHFIAVMRCGLTRRFKTDFLGSLEAATKVATQFAQKNWYGTCGGSQTNCSVMRADQSARGMLKQFQNPKRSLSLYL